MHKYILTSHACIILSSFPVLSFNISVVVKVKLESSGYELGPDLPAEEATRESLSLLIENTCLFSDLLLRLPDQLAGRLAARRDWDLLYRWALGLVRDLAFLDSATLRLLHLAAQEVGLVPREPDYRNPYRVEKKPQKRFEEPPQPVKKEKKKVKRGPKMSHNEL